MIIEQNLVLLSSFVLNLCVVSEVPIVLKMFLFLTKNRRLLFFKKNMYYVFLIKNLNKDNIYIYQTRLLKHEFLIVKTCPLCVPRALEKLEVTSSQHHGWYALWIWNMIIIIRKLIKVTTPVVFVFCWFFLRLCLSLCISFSIRGSGYVH